MTPARLWARAPRLLEGRVKGRLSLSKPLSLRRRSRPQKYVRVMERRRIPRPRCHSSACDRDRAGFSDHPALHVCSHHQFIWPEEHFFGGGWHCFLRIMSEATMRSDIFFFSVFIISFLAYPGRARVARPRIAAVICIAPLKCILNM